MIAHICEHGSIQTIQQHSRSVSALCGGYAAKFGMESTGKLIGLFHDLGKATDAFQAYIQSQDMSKRGSIIHSAAGARYIYERYFKMNQLAAQLICSCICSHHTGLMDCVTPDGKDGFYKKLFPEKVLFYEEAVQNFFAEVCTPEEADILFEKASLEVQTMYEKVCPAFKTFGLGLVQKLLLSCLLDADRYDSYCFELGITPEPESENLSVWQEAIPNVENKLNSFPNKQGINRLRREIADQCRAFAQNPGGIYRLYVPTGGGKTLASLRYALYHAKDSKLQHIFYLIPYTTILDQTSKIFRELCGSSHILEHHSNVVDEEREAYKLLCQRWDSPIVLTTMVQFLNTVFSGGTRNLRRLHTLCNSVLIFDEIQTIPVNCIHLFNQFINFLTAFCGSTVILCSATQPKFEDTAYPLQYSTPCDMVQDYSGLFTAFKRTEIVNLAGQGAMTREALAAFIVAEIEKVNTLLVIVNTKAAARNLYHAVQENVEDTEVLLLSTAFCQQHRKDILDKIKGNVEGKQICISTQLIEAGVDISFDCVIRTMAGIDSIAQAAGRCNRNQETDCRNVYVVDYRDENLSRLRDIRTARETTIEVLRDVGEADILSPEVINRYYSYYFTHQKNLMDYPVEKDTLVNLLSRNENGVRCYWDIQGKIPDLALKQAFKTAGDLFKVIDADTVSVIVPYQEAGEDCILRLSSAETLQDKLDCVKACKGFTVNVFQYELEKLQQLKAVHFIDSVGVWVLDKQYYSQEIGLTFDGQMPFLEIGKEESYGEAE